MSTPRQVREPVQAYLGAEDAELLATVAERLSVSKAEVIRQGIRLMAQELELTARPGAGLSALLGALEASPDVPTDLAARHDEYLYAERPTSPATLRRVSGPEATGDGALPKAKRSNAADTRRR